MILKFNFIDNIITFSDEYIKNLEIENKTYFYRTINSLNQISNGNLVDEANFFSKEYKELNLRNKIGIFIDYFNIDFNSKKHILNISNYVETLIDEENKLKLTALYKKIKSIFSKVLLDIDLDININQEFDTAVFLKILKLSLESKDNILDNLFLLIDIEKMFKINEILIFVNLKQYLKKEELEELFKYSIYSNVKIMLIDSQSYGINLNLEKKLIIDDSLEEFMI